MADYLLDTDVLVRCLRGFPQTLEMARGLTEEGDLHISVLSHLELLTLSRPVDESKTLDFMAPFILHPVTEPIAHRAALLLREAPTAEKDLNLSEAVVAATALQHSLTLVTYHAGSFEKVGALKVLPLPPAAR